jgi:hypothetical protein
MEPAWLTARDAAANTPLAALDFTSAPAFLDAMFCFVLTGSLRRLCE